MVMLGIYTLLLADNIRFLLTANFGHGPKQISLEVKLSSMSRIDTDIKLDFKDVLFRPKRSRIRSRADVSSRLFQISKGCIHSSLLPPYGRRLFFRGTHNVRDDLQLSHFVGQG